MVTPGIPRRLARVGVVVVVVVGARALLGVWAAAGLVAVLAIAGLIAGWAAVEARAFPRPVRSPERGPRAVDPGDHLAFTWALCAVAAAYRAHCEGQEPGR